MIFNKWIGRGLHCWLKIPCGFANNPQTKVVKFHQDSTVSMHGNFFLEQTDRGIIY